MTGFAHGLRNLDGGVQIRFEAKSLNHRFLDVKVKLPKEFTKVETFVRKMIQNKFVRGSIELRIDLVRDAQSGQAEYQVNKNALSEYYSSLNQFAEESKFSSKPSISDLLHFPDAFTKKSLGSYEQMDPQALWEILKEDVEVVTEDLHAMRTTEGNNLKNILQSKLAELKTHLVTIQSMREEWKSEVSKKITDRITQLFDSYPLDESAMKSLLTTRVSQELAVVLDRTDIEEEISRLFGHFNHFEEALNEGSPHGRKLDFLTQEMNREVNTLGNKAQDLGISKEIVQCKVLVEQLREQIMNVE